MNIGVIGCGNISATYFRLAPRFAATKIIACSDLDESAAQRAAQDHGCQAMSIDALCSHPDIDIVLNLTVPQAHFDVSRQALIASKHIYSEKPFVLSLQEGQQLQAIARDVNRRIGSAPDTFLGGAHQQARQLVDNGQRIGAINGGSCFFMNRGMENWHPNPDFFYQPGAGPMLDMGPYYLTNLVQLLGPVKRLMSMTSTPFSTRTIGSEPRAGETIPVGTPTTVHTLLAFESGAKVMLGMSWDVCQHEHNCMELYGSLATLHVPDPNFFGGEIRIATKDTDEEVLYEHPFAVPNDPKDDGDILANYRGIGLCDMAVAIHENREHRCNDQLAMHVIEIMTAALHSGETGDAVELTTRCSRPDAIDARLAATFLAS